MRIITYVSSFAMPLILMILAVLFVTFKRNLFDSFVSGALEGAKTCFDLLPTLLLIMCGVAALFSSGAVDILCSIFSPILSFLKIPRELIPTIVLRPFSGSATTAIADKLFRDFGADSHVSKIASVLMGSTDTIIYTLGMYFSASKIKKTRYALPASFVVFIFSIFVCTYIGRMML